ncbi:UNVERIFIED_CONTAM: putative cobalt transporter subunit CbtA [Williamsia faeni]
MEKKFIGAGLLSGLVAGLVAFIFARIYLEPLVDRAVGYEEDRSHAELELTGGEHGHEHELFSRTIQQNIGAGVGTVVFGLIMGAFFAVAFTVLWAYIGRRYPRTDPRTVAGFLATFGFVAVYLIPFCAYPANPPAVGEEDTIGSRSSAYLTIVLLSVAFMVAATVLAFWLAPKIGGLYSAIAGGAAYLVAVGITIALLPSFDEVPSSLMNGNTIVFPGFPADLVGDFRLYSVLNQVILWTVLGLVFAVILTVMGKRQARAAQTPASVSAG